jgi:hypothetical protein
VPEHLAHLVSAVLQPDAEEDVVDGGHQRTPYVTNDIRA